MLNSCRCVKLAACIAAMHGAIFEKPLTGKGLLNPAQQKHRKYPQVPGAPGAFSRRPMLFTIPPSYAIVLNVSPAPGRQSQAYIAATGGQYDPLS